MKALVSALLVSCALAAPFSAFAQSTANNAPLTRAAVQADLVRVEQAGFQPSGSQANYPDNIQKAEAIVARQNPQPDVVGLGSAVTSSGVSTGNQAVNSAGGHSIYFGD
ncbi:DUF4148 domain-containing protein [Pandoraea pneumonica]|uniref:DUF4148 domain-containing protein n=1 Tax=Pandoraea pneumonica TaxID=2508299 RepID=UPI003CF5BC70